MLLESTAVINKWRKCQLLRFSLPLQLSMLSTAWRGFADSCEAGSPEVTCADPFKSKLALPTTLLV